MPESAYERAVGSGGAPHSTFGAYDVAAGAGATGRAARRRARRRRAGGRRLDRTRRAAFKGAFGGRAGAASAVRGGGDARRDGDGRGRRAARRPRR